LLADAEGGPPGAADHVREGAVCRYLAAMLTVRSLLVLQLAASLLTIASRGDAQAAPVVHTLSSPDGRTQVELRVSDVILWSIVRDGRTIAGPSSAALVVDGQRSPGAQQSAAPVRRSVDEVIRGVFYARRTRTRDRFAELTLTFQRVAFRVRAYDDAVAYRWLATQAGPLRIDEELVRLSFPGDPTVRLSFADCEKARQKQADCFHTSFEEPYTTGALAALPRDRQGFLPTLVSHRDAGPHLLVTEADLLDYPGLWLRAVAAADQQGALEGLFARAPLEERITEPDEFPQAVVTRRASHLAATEGPRAFPWRVLALADRDVDLPASDIVYRLGGELAAGDWGWLRPGKSQSEWLWDNILQGVPFRSGLNTATYQHYLEFAARHRTGYLFFDAGWSAVRDVSAVTPGLDVPGLVAKARRRTQGAVLWTLASTVERDLEGVLDRLASWGAAGVLVDFMDRDDQQTVRFYERVVREAARRRLLVDFHGAFKPTGLERRYPNAVTREGFVAFEWNKWSELLTPDYEVTLPFIRGVVGAMDYEPGQMRNAQRERFKPGGPLPMSQGTRMHQAAMYLVYESPYAKLGGNVSDYEREPVFTRFLASIPTLWRETRTLDGKVAEFIVTERRAADGTIWVGAMTGWSARTLALPLSFLPEGRFTAELWEDGPNADRLGTDWRRRTRVVTRRHTLPVAMAPGGGWVAHFTPN